MAKENKINMGQALFSDRERFEMWFSENWKRTAIISLAAVVAVSVAFGVKNHIEESRAEAASTLAAADTVDALKAALKKHPDSSAAPIAKLRLANMLFDKADYAGAIVYLKEIADASDADVVVKNAAKMNYAKALELTGKTEDAAKAFASIAATDGVNFSVKSEAAFNAARLYAKLGKTKAALEEIQNISISGNTSGNPMMNVYAESANALKIAIENGEYGKIR